MRLIENELLILNDLLPAPSPVTLSPSQQSAADALLRALAATNVLLLKAPTGMGRTSILRHLQALRGGALVETDQVIEEIMVRNPAALEEAFFEAVRQPLDSHNLILIDDLHLISNVVNGHYYPRSGLLAGFLNTLLNHSERHGQTLVFAYRGEYPPHAISKRAHIVNLSEFTSEDYRHISQAYLQGSAADKLDFERIHRFAPSLNAHQLKTTCRMLALEAELDTDKFTTYLTGQNLVGNTDLDQVEHVTWKNLQGMDDVIEALEAKIALPFENDALASEFRLKPKRGVLLVGPPGTGKTTIGRALAHRLKGKFLLIDGTAIAGSCSFYDDVIEVFENAKRNAPSVVFIDDADVIFAENREPGLYRYLLTVLDGLESAASSLVCVMMTAMDVTSLPAPLLRSGRIELWLETRLPDADARRIILDEKLAALPEPFAKVDTAAIAAATDGLTGADLKNIVEDGKLLFAHGQLTGKSPRPAEEYFLEAVAAVRANRRRSIKPRRRQLVESTPVGFTNG
jgi:ATP-dependent 26S proteasome regulatory subunit